ncbi:MAG: phosphatase [Peptostreptococcaceae bacterium]|nr:phosphatase [Peptostreptococcaceae bacterium]
MLFDLHCHTIASGHAFSTLKELCIEAKKKGLKLIAQTDHGPNMPGGPHIYHINNQRIIPRILEGVMVLRGVEANIIDFKGRLDIDEGSLKELDLVIASLHPPCLRPGNKIENTKALLRAMDNPYVDIIGHPGNPQFEIDIDAVVKKAKEKNILLEINNSSFGKSRPGSKELCKKIINKANENKTKMVVGTDSHIYTQIGDFSLAKEVIKNTNLTDDLIVNYDLNWLIEFLESKNKKYIGEIKEAYSKIK